MKISSVRSFAGSLVLMAAVVGMIGGRAEAATYYWDGNDGTAGFGTASGTWAAPTAGTATSGWSTDSSGATVVNGNSVTTATADGINFGNGATALGAGTITVSGTVDAGNMTFASGSGAIVLSGGTITLAAAETITVNNAANTISSILAGAATSLTKAGTGTLTLAGDNSYSGVTAISGGILAIAHNNALGNTTGDTTVTATGSSTGPQLRLSGNITSPENISISGTTETGNYAAAIFNTSGTNTLSGNITLASPSGDIRLGSGAGELIFAGTISQTGQSRILYLQASAGAALTVNNAIANNNGPLSVLSPGGVTLKAVSTAIGATGVGEQGLLKLGVNNALKTTSDLTIGFPWNFTGSDQGTFDLAGFDQTVNALIGTRNTSNVGADSTRVVTNSDAGTGTNTLTVGNGDGTGVFNGVIVDGATAKVALTKIGTGTETLMAASTYSGGTVINGGILAVGHNSALGDSAGPITVLGIGGALATTSLQLNNGITVTGRTLTLDTMGGRSALRVNTGTTGTWAGDVVLTNGAAFAQLVADGNLTVSGNIAGDNSPSLFVVRGAAGTGTLSGNLNISSTDLVKTDTGTWIINTTGHTWGNTTVAHGTLRLGVTDALPTTTVLTMGQATTGGTLDLNGKNQTLTGLAENAAVFVKTITSATPATLTIANSSDYSYGASGGIIGGAVALVKDGTGMQTLSGTNTYTGVTTINNGILSVSANSGLGAVATGAQVNLGGGTLQLNGSFALDKSGSSKRNISLTADSTIGVTAANTATISGEISGSGFGFAKEDTGTLRLTGNNSYSGATTVDSGTLRIDGNQSGATGAVTVNSGATLGGTGTSGGALSGDQWCDGQSWHGRHRGHADAGERTV